MRELILFATLLACVAAQEDGPPARQPPGPAWQPPGPARQPPGPMQPTMQPQGPSETSYTFAETYSAIMPKVMSPDQMFDVSVTHVDPPSSGVVSLKVEIRQNGDDSTVLAEKMADMPQAQCNGDSCYPVTAIVSVKTPAELAQSEYNVTVSGRWGNQSFFNSSLISVKRTTFSLFIQTDKPLYKPSQEVKFRVIAIDKNGQSVNQLVNISFIDNSGNVLKQWNNRDVSTVISEKFQLSDQPPLGMWTIKVMAKDIGTEKTIEVAEYVLPKIEVSLKTPSFILTTDKKIVASASAKYTYGQPVRGKCTMKLSMVTSSYERAETKYHNFTQEMEQGRANFEYRMADLEGLVPPPYSVYDRRTPVERMAYRQFNFSVCCTEELTGKEFCKAETSSVYTQKFQMTIEAISPNFRSGMVYYAQIKLRLADNSVVSPRDIKFPNGSDIYVNIYDADSYYYDRKVPVARLPLDSNGNALLKIVAPENISQISLIIFFNDTVNSVQTSHYVTKFKTRDPKAAIQLHWNNTERIIKGNEASRFEVRTLSQSSIISFQFLAKGEVVLSEVKVFIPGTHHIYELFVDDMLAQKLAPKARLVAWTLVNTPGLGLETITDSMDFDVAGFFANEVSVSFDKDTAEPGMGLQLMVNAEESSYVALVAIDTSLRLLSSDPGFTQDVVMDAMEAYDATQSDDDFVRPMAMVRGKRSVYFPGYMTGGMDSSEVFSNAGLVVLTDIYMYVEPPMRYDYIFRGERPMMGAAGPPGPAGPQGESGPRGPVADSAPSSSKGASNSFQQPTTVRKDFPETWLWVETETGPDGKTIMNVTAPDTITTYVTSAFAIHHVKGLGIAPVNAEVTIFKPFFISLDLPYSVIRGEEFEMKMIIFNYQSEPAQVKFEIPKSMEYGVKMPNDIDYSHAAVHGEVTVPANDGKTIRVLIKPTVLGNIDIEAIARSHMAADHVISKLLVEVEGAPVEDTTNLFVQMQNGGIFFEDIDIELPMFEEGLVPGSVKIYASAIGDIMGPAISGLDGLVRMPYGCGEQNMLNLAPNVFVMDYLTGTNKQDPEIKVKAVEYMEQGYQRELTYQHHDGSYSAFGNSDPSGSTWLTAFVVKTFFQARDYIYIDMANLLRSANWLIERQRSDGSFDEPGRVIHTEMQGGTSSGVTLTAYVTMTLIELREAKEFGDDDALVRIDMAIKKALKYLEAEMKIPTVYTDPYVMSIMAYTMALADHSNKTAIFSHLTTMSQSTGTGGLKYFDKKKSVDTLPDPNDEPIMWKPHTPESSAVESTAYALLAYTLMDKKADAVPIMKWLLSQRNAYGGYSSTQDTVMALFALGSYAASLSEEGGVNMKISVRTKDTQMDFMNITADNSLILQKILVSTAEISQTLTIEAQGSGMALVQIAVRYNVIQTHESPDIDLEVQTIMNEDGTVTTKICAGYMRKEESGMALISADMLSGFVPTNLDQITNARRVDQNDKTFSFYFDQFPSGELTCITLISEQVHKVNNIQKAKVVAYPYYKPLYMKTAFYLPVDMLNDDECLSCPSTDNDINVEFRDKQKTGKANEIIQKGHDPNMLHSVQGNGATQLVPMAFMIILFIIVI